MRATLVLGGAFLLLCGVSGCGTDMHDKLARETLKAYDDLNAVLTRIKDEKTAKTNSDRLLKAYQHLKVVETEAKKYEGSLTEEEKDQLLKEYGPQFKAKIKKMQELWAKLDKGTVDVLRKELESKGFPFPKEDKTGTTT